MIYINRHNAGIMGELVDESGLRGKLDVDPEQVPAIANEMIAEKGVSPVGQRITSLFALPRREELPALADDASSFGVSPGRGSQTWRHAIDQQI